MKAKLQAGMELDLLSKAEVAEVLTEARASWQKEIARGVRFRSFSSVATVAGGVWSIGAAAGVDQLGPREGFIWSVTRIAVSGPGLVLGTDLFSAYVSEVTPVKLIQSGLTRGAQWDMGVLVLVGGDRLTLAGVGTGVGEVYVSGAAVELPVQLAFQLLA